ncbi:ABC transporter permease [Paraburkholderia lycopersici]|uniref:NitT/TauT family transport system permease protein n=1 Tax=Paraburkholderia lycopersici TaxID=416944 RepID=A0A1G6QS98_9BURK|nr:ABC transporter permease [Paraburkholderia lycopersici]SDC95163.1 NitT/TauT family transport system permease protein [Paraburkholderia lycopersici]
MMSRKAEQQTLTAVPPRRARTYSRSRNRMARRVVIARTLLIVAVLVIWQALVSGGLVDPFWISSPVLVAKELWSQASSGTLVSDIGITVFEALIAFVISAVLGIASGLLLARSPFWDMVLAPLIVVVNSMPRVAIAPLIILWFGIGLAAKVITAFTLVYFILLVNTLNGAKNVDNDIRTIALLMGASRKDMLFKVTLPSALPWIFAGLNLGLTYSLLGVIVAEILSSNEGLGFVIAHNAGNFNTAGVFAGLIALSFVAWVFAIVMRTIESRLLSWKPSTTSA